MPDQEADEDVVSDPELITRVRAGDRSAFGELYRRHSGPATTLSRQFARSAAESDDLVSESFARVLDNLLSGKGPDTAFRAYLFTTIRNTAYDRTRKDKKLQFTDDMTTHDVAVVGDDPVLAKMESGLVATAFAQLPERWQAVLWHTQVEGESPAKVGAMLGMAPGAVSSLAFRAREGLREAYLQAHLAETAAEQCRKTVERLGAWTRGGLSKREKAQVDAHLETCDRCRALAAELEEVNSGLRGLLAPLLLGGAAAGYLATLGPVAPLAAPGTLVAGAGAAGAAGSTGGSTAGGGTTAGAGRRHRRRRGRQPERRPVPRAVPPRRPPGQQQSRPARQRSPPGPSVPRPTRPARPAVRQPVVRRGGAAGGAAAGGAAAGRRWRRRGRRTRRRDRQHGCRRPGSGRRCGARRGRGGRRVRGVGQLTGDHHRRRSAGGEQPVARLDRRTIPPRASAAEHPAQRDPAPAPARGPAPGRPA